MLIALAGATAAHAQAPSDSLRQALRTWRGKVTYLAGPSIYVDAGRLDGLLPGDTLSLWRADDRVALVRVDALASHRVTCDTLATWMEVQLGDGVRFVGGTAPPGPKPKPAPALTVVETPAVATPAAAAPPTMTLQTPSATAMRPSRPLPRLRGRVGLQHLSVQSDGGAKFEQPMLDLRVEQRLDRVAMDIDLRGRRTVVTASDGEAVTQALTRVQRASLTYGEATGLRTAVGRQSAPSLGVVSVFDGALVEHRGSRWSMGAFAGTQPEPVRMRVDGAVREFGAFVEAASPALASDRWTVTLGAVSSYDHETPDREFGYLQGFMRKGPATTFFTQEIDLQRAWERALGEPAVSFSSSYASVNWQVRRSLSLSTGYDNRRRVRLWRDRDTPETQFDDRYRQGTWTGASWNPWRPLRLGGEYRVLRGGDPADSWTLSTDLVMRRRWAPTARARVSAFDGRANESGLWSAGFGASPWPGGQVYWSSGERHTREFISDITSRTRWNEWTLEAAVGRRWYGSLSWEEDRGELGGSRQVLAGLSWRL